MTIYEPASWQVLPQQNQKSGSVRLVRSCFSEIPKQCYIVPAVIVVELRNQEQTAVLRHIFQ